VATGGDGQLLGSVEHVLALQAKVPGELINSDFAAAGHSGLQSIRARCDAGALPRGQWSSCLSVSGGVSAQTLLEGCGDRGRHRAAKSLLQPLSADGFLKALGALAEIGRAAEPFIEHNSILMIADDTPERRSIREPATSRTASEYGARPHRAPPSMLSSSASFSSAATSVSSWSAWPKGSSPSCSSSGRG